MMGSGGGIGTASTTIGIDGNLGSSGLSNGHPLDDGNTSRYMLDIHLFKGTVYVFMDFVRQFMHIITASCSLCSNNSCYTSSNNSSNALGDYKQAIHNVAVGNHPHDNKLKLLI